MKRKVELESVNDNHIVDFWEQGITRDGIPTSNRQALKRVLGKRIPNCLGVKDEDGEIAMIPIFIVRSIGKWIYEVNERPEPPRTQEALEFDNTLKIQNDKNPEIDLWKKHKAEMLKKREQRAAYANMQLEQAIAADIVDSLKQLVGKQGKAK